MRLRDFEMDTSVLANFETMYYATNIQLLTGTSFGKGWRKRLK
jgi:hypothetical protein